MLLKWYLALMVPLFLQKATYLSIKHLFIAKMPYPGCSFQDAGDTIKWERDLMTSAMTEKNYLLIIFWAPKQTGLAVRNIALDSCQLLQSHTQSM